MRRVIIIVSLAVFASGSRLSCSQEQEKAEARGEEVWQRCKPNGEWEMLQRKDDATVWCVHPNGEMITEPFMYGTCTCIAHRLLVLSSGKQDELLPECEKSGYFKEIQCHKGRCYCVEPRFGAEAEDKELVSVDGVLSCDDVS